MEIFLFLGRRTLFLSRALAGLVLRKQASELGRAEGAVNIGRCYEKGLGVEADARGAEWYYRKAAEAGDAEGARNLGRCFEKGIGVMPNPEQAAWWDNKAGKLEVMNTRRTRFRMLTRAPCLEMEVP